MVLGRHDIERKRTTPCEPPAQLRTRSASLCDVQPRARDVGQLPWPPPYSPGADVAAMLFPPRAKTYPHVFALVPRSQTQAINKRDQAGRSYPWIAQNASPTDHHNRAGQLHGIRHVTINAAGNKPLGRVEGDG